MRTRFLTAALSLLVTSAALPQTGALLLDHDAYTAGRAGVSTGTFDNSSLLINNPAGISFLPQSQLDISFSLMVPGLRFTNAYNSNAGDIRHYFPLPSVGFVKKVKESPLTWGAGLYVQGGMGAEFMLNHPLFTDGEGGYTQQRYYSNFAVMQGGPSIAYKFHPHWSLGASAHLLYSQMEFNMPYSLPPQALMGVIFPGQSPMTFGDLFSASPDQGGLGYSELTAYAKMTGLKAFGFNGKIGLAYQPSERFSFGINYSTPVTLTYKNGTASMDMNAQLNDAFGRVVAGIMYQNPDYTQEQAQQAAMQQFGQMGIDLSKGGQAVYDLKNKMTLPQTLSAGFSVLASPHLRLGMDVEWINWKNAFNEMQLSMSNGANPNINRMMGNEGSFSMKFPLQWKNSVVIRTGVEALINTRWTARAGYAYNNNPVPSETLFPVFPAIIEHHITAGVSYKLTSRLALNLAYEAGLNNTQTASANSLIAHEYDNSRSSLKTSIYHASLSWKW